MKVYKTERAPSGKSRLLLALGREELDLLLSLIDSAKKSGKLGLGDKENIAYKRLRNMSRIIHDYILGRSPSTKKRSIARTHQCPHCERILRGEEALKAHQEKSHKELGESE